MCQTIKVLMYAAGVCFSVYLPRQVCLFYSGGTCLNFSPGLIQLAFSGEATQSCSDAITVMQ